MAAKRVSDAAIAELKARNPCDAVIGKWVKLRRHGQRMIGPCPFHSPDANAADSTAFECDADGWVCAVCEDGGDVLRAMALREGLDPQRDFLKVIDLLGGVVEPDADRAAELEREQSEKRKRREQEGNIFRESERRTALELYERGEPLWGTPVEYYLRRARAIEWLPDDLQLRFAPEIAFFHGTERNEIDRQARRVIYRGPAMLAPIVDTHGVFRAVHMTWLDLERPSGKALIVDPDTQKELLPKKVRGSKAGNAIRLVDVSAPAQLQLGEGIETVLSVWYALSECSWDLSRAAFWSTVDLGNLAGKSVKSVAHPTLKNERNRARFFPGPEPDMEAPAIVIPETVDDAILLGDGDSDRFVTQCALARATKRYARPGLAVRTAWADDGADFNDMVRVARENA